MARGWGSVELASARLRWRRSVSYWVNASFYGGVVGGHHFGLAPSFSADRSVTDDKKPYLGGCAGDGVVRKHERWCLPRTDIPPMVDTRPGIYIFIYLHPYKYIWTFGRRQVGLVEGRWLGRSRQNEEDPKVWQMSHP